MKNVCLKFCEIMNTNVDIYIQVFIDLYTKKFIPVDSPQLQLSNYPRLFVLYDDTITM